MKHLGRVSVVPDRKVIFATGREPGRADAKGDLMNAVWKAWNDFVAQKKNEVAV